MSTEQYFFLRRTDNDKARIEQIVGIVNALEGLPLDKAFRVDISEKRRTRTVDQNSLLWSMYTEVLKQGGETLGGWTKEDLHEYCLGTHYGWETTEAFGKKRLRPLKRSSKLSITEFSEFVDFIQRHMAEFGIVLQDRPQESP